MRRWTIKELDEESDLKLAACILSERRERLNPYSPLATKLKSSENLLLRMDEYLGDCGIGSGISAKRVVNTLYQDGYTDAVRLIERMVAGGERAKREHEILNRCFECIAEKTNKKELVELLRNTIGLTDEEIELYELDWTLDKENGGVGSE